MKTFQKFVLAAAVIATLSIGAASATESFAGRGSKTALLTHSHNVSSVALTLHRKVNEYEGQH